MEKVALDVDDVLAAFSPWAHNFHKVPMEGKVDYWCEKTMDSRLGTEWFSKHIAPVEEFWRTIPRLSNPEDIDFEVTCYMSAFPEEMYDIRVKWLRDNGFPDVPLVVAFDKLEKCREMGINVLVDDKPAMIKKLQGTEVKGIHFMAPYAGFEPVGINITNLNQVKQYL